MSSGGERLPEPAAAWRFLIGSKPDIEQGVSIPSAFTTAPVNVWPVEAQTDMPGTPPPLVPAAVSRLHIIAESTEWLRRFANQTFAIVTTSQITIVIHEWRTPWRGWSGRLGALPFTVRHEVRLPTSGVGRAVVDVVLSQPHQLDMVILAALHALTPSSPFPTVASAEISVIGARPEWLVQSPNTATYSGELPVDDAIRAHDIVLCASCHPDRADELIPGAANGHFAAGLDAGHNGVQVTNADYRVLVNAISINPRGRAGFDRRIPVRAMLSASVEPSGLRWRLETTEPIQRSIEGDLEKGLLDIGHLNAVRSIDVVSCESFPGENPVAEAALLIQMAMAGVVVHAPNLNDATTALFAQELRDQIRVPLPGRAASALEWDERTVRMRRAALRHHAAWFAMPQLTGTVFPTLARPPTVTALMVTRRPDFLEAALRSIGAQTYPELEIVLGLHGFPPTAEVHGIVERCRRPLEVVAIPASVSFGEALGMVTARARGTLLTKFDDDDIYGPEHVWDLVLARHFSGANVVGKGAEFVYLEPLNVTVRRRGVESEDYVGVVTGGTLLLSRGDLEAVGGWRPVSRSVDRGLLDRIHRGGGVIYRTHPLGFIYRRHSVGHTWDPGIEYFLRNTGMQWPGLPQSPEFGTMID